MPVIYQGELYCDDCGKEIESILRRREKEAHDHYCRSDSEEWQVETKSILNDDGLSERCFSTAECPNGERVNGRRIGQLLTEC